MFINTSSIPQATINYATTSGGQKISAEFLLTILKAQTVEQCFGDQEAVENRKFLHMQRPGFTKING